MYQKKASFSALEMPGGTSDKCFAWRKCLFQWPGSWKLLVTSQLRQFSMFLWWKMPSWRIVGLMGLVQTWSADYLVFVLVYAGGSSSWSCLPGSAITIVHHIGIASITMIITINTAITSINSDSHQPSMVIKNQLTTINHHASNDPSQPK